MFKIIFHIRKLNILSVLAYRISFFVQIFSMALSDVVMLMVFYFFFSSFGTIAGMDFQGYIRLLLVILGGYCVMSIFFYGSSKIGEMVMAGSLDAHLLLPKNILLRILTGGFSITAVGDLIYGIGLLFLIKNLTLVFVLKRLLVSLCAGITFTGFMVVFESLAFWMGSSKELSRAIFEAIVGPSHYPPGIFKGVVFKVMFMTVIPIFFISYLPYDMISSEFTLQKIFMLLGATIFFGGLGIFVFYRGLRRYESGNMMNVNI